MNSLANKINIQIKLTLRHLYFHSSVIGANIIIITLRYCRLLLTI